MLEKSILIYIEDNDYGYDSIFIDKGINCDTEYSEFVNVDDSGVEYEDNKFFDYD